MVVTDDEASYSAIHEEGEKSTKSHQRVQKLRSKGHRRTASTGSNIVVFPRAERESATGSLNQPAPHSHTSKQPLKPIPKYPKRPGSAGSTRPDVRQITGIESPEHIAQTAQEVTKHMTKLINESAVEGTPTGDSPEKGKSDSNPKPALGQRSNRPSQGMPVHVHISQSGQPAKTKHKYSEITRSKPVNKSTDSNETTSSEGTSSGSSKSSNGANKHPADSTAASSQSLSLTGEAPEGESVPQKTLTLLDKAKDLSRTESMSSTTSSSLSIFGPSCMLPSRNHSFVYDGGESSPYSHESLEIGDSIESLQALGMGKLGYSPYILPIPHKRDTTSSSEEDAVKERDHRFSRRKRSSATTIDGSHEAPHHKSI